MQFGDLELISLSDGFFRLDGGAMFGVVPKPLWERRAAADERNRILMGLRPLVVRPSAGAGRAGRTLIIDAGIGDKMDAKRAGIYGIDRTRHLDHALADAGLSPADIDLALATHLHFDHVGGFTAPGGAPRFPRARYLARSGEWEAATHPHERNRASYLAENLRPLAEAGVLDLHEGDCEIVPGVRVVRSGGHTMDHEVVMIESGGRTAVFAADMIPTTAHVDDAWIMAYDLHPLDTLAFKRRFIREAIDREYLIFFEHDPRVAAGYIREEDGRRVVEPVIVDSPRV